MEYAASLAVPPFKNKSINSFCFVQYAQPWEPQCFYPDFPYEIICGDSWSDNRLVLATESGVFVVEGKQTPRRFSLGRTRPNPWTGGRTFPSRPLALMAHPTPFAR
jgi:hypothetical protein